MGLSTRLKPDRVVPISGQEAFQGRNQMSKISSLRGRMLLFILPAVVLAIAILTVMSISRANRHETEAVNEGLRNRTGQEAAAVNGVVQERFAQARTAAATVAAHRGGEFGELMGVLKAQIAANPGVEVIIARVPPSLLNDGGPFLPAVIQPMGNGKI